MTEHPLFQAALVEALGRVYRGSYRAPEFDRFIPAIIAALGSKADDVEGLLMLDALGPRGWSIDRGREADLEGPEWRYCVDVEHAGFGPTLAAAVKAAME